MRLYEEFNSLFDRIYHYSSLIDESNRRIIILRKNLNQNLETLSESCESQIADNAGNINRVKSIIHVATSHSTRHILPTRMEPFESISLSRLMVQVDDSSKNDPFAEQLFTKANAQLLYLQNNETQIRADFEEKKREQVRSAARLIEAEEDKIEVTEKDLQTFLESSRVTDFISRVKNSYAGIYSAIENSECPSDYVNIGNLEIPILLKEDLLSKIAVVFDSIYSPRNKRIRIPYEYSINGGVLIAEYNNATEQSVFPLYIHLILGIAEKYADDFDQVVYIDPIRFNNLSLGVIARFAEGKHPFIEKTPASTELLKKKIESLIANISYAENKLISIDNSLSHKLFIFHDFPQGYDQQSILRIKQLCVNAKHYGFTVVLSTNTDERKSYLEDALSYIKAFSDLISCKDDAFCLLDEKNTPFVSFFKMPDAIPDDILSKIHEQNTNIKEGNDYLDRVGLSWSFSHKGNRYLSGIPYGINKDNELLTLDFENTNFATFVCGASRSGKSTLLHTLLTGIFANYHPDDVEIWLIDFKMTEFSRYINHLPPHIRYLILDESPELVYDIINRLTEILTKRQNRFKGKWEKLSQVPKNKYMPSIFVVIDEFSVMSQIISDSINVTNENYSAKLQMLLAKGAALGLHFIFASQGFSNGTRGLSEYSKEQIQQRIAMKTKFSEIKETLDLKNASDNDIAMMEQLPVHHTLTRIPVDEFGNHLELANVLYFTEDGKEKQLEMIDSICHSTHTEKVFSPFDESAFIDKKALVIDGNSYKTYDGERYRFESYISSYLNSNSVFFIGEPRRMIPVYPIDFSETFCENVLTIGPVTEKMALASVLLSLSKTVELQGYSVSIFGHKKSHLLNQLSYGCKVSYPSYSSLEEICGQISKIKEAIVQGVESKTFYLLLGFETLINEMSFLDESLASSRKKPKSNNITKALAEQRYDKRDEGQPDLMQQIAMRTQTPKVDFSSIEASVISGQSDHGSKLDEFEAVGEYDARQDLKFILSQGPRLGYHFVMHFNSYTELEHTRTDLSYFRHKVLFRMPKSNANFLVGASQAAIMPELPDHVFRYHDGINAVSFRPLLHPGLSWDGWSMDLNGSLTDVDDDEEYLM